MSLLITLSPAKKIQTPASETAPRVDCTVPQFMPQTRELLARLKTLNGEQLQTLMNISSNIAQENLQRYQCFPQNDTGLPKAPCVLQFNGDVYKHLNAEQFDKATQERAQQSLIILSGLYGMLRPYDRMHPYRLEMGCSVKPVWGFKLVDFWQERLTTTLTQQLANTPFTAHINLASKEYAQALNTQKLPIPSIEVVFASTTSQGALKVIGVQAKRARGAMARFILENDLKQPEELTRFNALGFCFQKTHSSPNRFVFTAQ